ncbi:MAG: hypothetical protein PVF58_04615 [Candidatus Methanofastidiosia archaeon]|jgi:hypothetical protein
MGKIAYEKKVPVYHKIYEQMHEEPLICFYEIGENIGVSRSSTTRYIKEMYHLSILDGPRIFLNPAKNYHQFAYLLQCEDPLSVYAHTEDFPSILFKSVEFGNWNLFIISEKKIDFSSLEGVKQNFFQGTKGMTYFSTVTSLDWDASLEAMYDAAYSLKKKSTLYHEIPRIPWNEKEWSLYHEFKNDIRKKKIAIIEKHKIPYNDYRHWLDTLPKYTAVQTRFYPYKRDSYLAVDFLFESQYHTQLKDILGLLPSTGVFFSVGTHMLARIFYLTKKEKDELLTFILHLGKKGYYTAVHHALVVSYPAGNENMINI